jgi:hypothetical protein
MYCICIYICIPPTPFQSLPQTPFNPLPPCQSPSLCWLEGSATTPVVIFTIFTIPEMALLGWSVTSSIE